MQPYKIDRLDPISSDFDELRDFDQLTSDGFDAIGVIFFLEQENQKVERLQENRPQHQKPTSYLNLKNKGNEGSVTSCRGAASNRPMTTRQRPLVNLKTCPLLTKD